MRISIDELEFDYGRIKILSKNITIGSNKYTFIDKYSLNKNGNINEDIVSFSFCLDDLLSDNTSLGTSKEHSDLMTMLCTIVPLQIVIVTIFIFKTINLILRRDYTL